MDRTAPLRAHRKLPARSPAPRGSATSANVQRVRRELPLTGGGAELVRFDRSQPMPRGIIGPPLHLQQGSVRPLVRFAATAQHRPASAAAGQHRTRSSFPTNPGHNSQLGGGSTAVADPFRAATAFGCPAPRSQRLRSILLDVGIHCVLIDGAISPAARLQHVLRVRATSAPMCQHGEPSQRPTSASSEPTSPSIPPPPRGGRSAVAIAVPPPPPQVGRVGIRHIVRLVGIRESCSSSVLINGDKEAPDPCRSPRPHPAVPRRTSPSPANALRFPSNCPPSPRWPPRALFVWASSSPFAAVGADTGPRSCSVLTPS